MGHQVLQTHSGRSALNLLEKEEVDLMITDFAMPRMTGGELLQAARREKPDLKVIVASGYADLPDGVALDVPRLAKPFTDAELAVSLATSRL